MMTCRPMYMNIYTIQFTYFVIYQIYVDYAAAWCTVKLKLKTNAQLVVLVNDN